ncbi:hypothetical protein CPB84DRAFT_1833131 [Gymnopilus junonius]|uniref:BZIP domain-containing protein n=1 Tax=Gymnopilus junonius TaxID=109634 RepID=A0A9P5NY43_GYMJU|nr:hypothetical protein CPB84DRAFT_1833131 [Gymnopilus junonius]
MTSISSSSTTTLWATASKEWVIQPKPKPGRKPKKDVASPSKTETEAEGKGRRIQNRAAQRAFRERKQSQLSELQARIQLYEQGEIERNVALQNIAKRLKEENERLRQENQALHARILQMQHQSNTTQAANQCISPGADGADKKRWRDESPSNLSVQSSTHKRQRRDSNSTCPPLVVPSALHLPSPSSTIVSTPEPIDTPHSPFDSISYDLQQEINTSNLNRFNDLSAEAKNTMGTLPTFPSFGCGFCDERTICVCHEIAVQHVAENAELKANTFTETLVDQGNNTIIHSPVQVARPSILDNLPEYQPPVALRRRSSGVLVNSVFPVEAGGTNGTLDAIALMQISSSDRHCCRVDGSGCADCPSSLSSEHADLMPTNDAWRQLKAHPNVEFADLSLLAEVVSSRSKCSGPRLMASPAPQNVRGASSPPK